MRHRRPTRRTPRLLAAGLTLMLAVLGAGAAWAYWSTAGTGAAAANVATFNPPTNVTATNPAGTGTVNLTWTAGSLSTGGAPSGYYLTRVTEAGPTSSAACASSPTTLITGTSCTDSGLANGSYHYLVTAVYHSWTAVSAASNSVTVSINGPTVTVEQASGQADPTNALPVRFTVTFSAPVVDFGSAAVSTGGTAPGSRTVGVTGSGASYTVTVTGLTGSGTVTASVPANAAHTSAGAGNSASTSTDNTVTYDPVAPSAPAPAVTAPTTYGSNPTYLNLETVTFTDAATDADSGVQTVSYYACAGASGSCTSGTGTLLGSSSTATGGYPVSTAALTTEGAYRIVAVVTDKAGNATTSAPTAVSVDSTPPTVARPTVNGHA